MKINYTRIFGILFSSLSIIGLLIFTVNPPVYASSPPAAHQFLADVNGDGKGDAITFDSHTGDWWVALSDGSKFLAPSRWITGFGVGSSRQMLADVTGEGAADAVTFDVNTGDWWVAQSTPTGFTAPNRWISGHGKGSTNQFLMLLDSADAVYDAVVFFNNTGAWYGAPSAGSSGYRFGNGSPNYFPPLMRFGFGIGSSNQFVSNVAGAAIGMIPAGDLVTFDAKTGDWWVSKNNGVGNFFATPTRWITGYGIGSSNQFVEQVGTGGTGGGAAVTFDIVTGDWWTAGSNGSGSAFINPGRWISGHGVGSTTQFLANADVGGSLGVADAGVFFGSNGNWYIAPSDGSKFGNGSPYYFPPLWINGFGVGTN